MDLEMLLQGVKDDHSSPDFLSTPWPFTVEEQGTDNLFLI
jgi:hypothetical protein